MKRILVLTSIAVAALVPQPVGAAQLLREEVRGIWRTCSYRAPVGAVLRRQGTLANQPLETSMRVGRGEPCPARYRAPPRTRGRQVVGPTAWPNPLRPNGQ